MDYLIFDVFMCLVLVGILVWLLKRFINLYERDCDNDDEDNDDEDTDNDDGDNEDLNPDDSGAGVGLGIKRRRKDS